MYTRIMVVGVVVVMLAGSWAMAQPPVKPSEILTESRVVASSENLTGASDASGCRFPSGLSLGRPGDRRS